MPNMKSLKSLLLLAAGIVGRPGLLASPRPLPVIGTDAGGFVCVTRPVSRGGTAGVAVATTPA